MSSSNVSFSMRRDSYPRSTDRRLTDKSRSQSHFNFEFFLEDIRFFYLVDLDDTNQLTEELEKIDPLEMLKAVNAIQYHLTNMQLENHFVRHFLEKNDPKMLIGLEKRRASSITSGVPSQKSGGGTLGSSFTNRSVNVMTRSTRRSQMSGLSMASSLLDKRRPGGAGDLHLTCRTKMDMVDQVATDLKRSVKMIEKKSMATIKELNAFIEESKCTSTEADTTARNFELHFLHNHNDLVFLDNATDVAIEKKLRKFLDNWFKNGRALLATMRMRTTTLQDGCRQRQLELISKSDLNGILTPVDFQHLKIKHESLLLMFEEKTANLTGLKGVTGRASISMAREKRKMIEMQADCKSLSAKANDAFKMISRLNNENNAVEQENEKLTINLQKLKNHLERFEAPSTSEYIRKKDELAALEKEERMLKRKLNLISMKASNIRRRYKRLEEFALDDDEDDAPDELIMEQRRLSQIRVSEAGKWIIEKRSKHSDI